MSLIKFSKGVYSLNKEPNFNYQLNRTIMWSNGDIDEIKMISNNIKSTEDWVIELSKLGDAAINSNNIEKAIAYYRMAEFFEFNGNPNKIFLYRKARELFYTKNNNIFKTIIKKEYIPFDDSELPIWIAIPQNKSVDTIILHGGNDSYIEEFLPIVLYFLDNNITVYLFEGPGQGEVLREKNMPFTHEWEKPVKCILDKYKITNSTIIGISLGAMLAPRAAAFDKRIKRVVAWSIMPNFLDVLLSTRKRYLQIILRTALKLKLKTLINIIAKIQMKKDPLAKWGILHGMHNMGVKKPYGYFKKADQFQITDIGNMIDQDFLLIGAQNDHFIPLKMYKNVIDSLPNVKSLTFRLFTKQEDADNHCNAGNTELVLKTIVDWIKLVK